MLKFDENNATEIALIKKNKNTVQRIYMTDNLGEIKNFVSKKNDKLKIIDNVFDLPKGFSIEISPFLKENQNIRALFIGASGSGKTTLAANFAYNFSKMYSKKEIFLFSRHEYDPSIDELLGNKIVRIKVDENKINESIAQGKSYIEITDLSNSLCIFDDAVQSSKILTKYLNTLNDDLQMNGRKYDISIINIIHNTNYKDTRLSLSEATLIVLFLNGSLHLNKRILKTYCGFNEIETEYLLNLQNTRWVCVKTVVPMFIMTENKIFTRKYLNIVSKKLP